MSTANRESTLNDRVVRLERQAVVWRNVAVGASLLLATVTLTALHRAAAGPLEGESLTIHGLRGAAVTLSLTATGDLEARFAPGEARVSGAGPSLLIVDANGRTVARLGAPSARNVAP